MAGAGFPQPDGRCERAHQWSSLRLDGELSELEVALLEKHLDGCSGCRAFDTGLRSSAELLRTAPFEAPACVFEVPRQRTGVPLVRVLAVAAVVAAAALGSLVGSSLQRQAPQGEEPDTRVSFLTRDTDRDQLRQLPRNGRVAPETPARELGGLPEGII